VEELDGRRTDSVPDFCGSPCGQWDFEFFPLKIARAQQLGVPLGSIIGGSRTHALNFNWMCGNLRNFRNHRFLSKAKVQLPKLYPLCPWDPRISQSKFWPWPLTILNKKPSIRWQDSKLPISGYWPASEPNAGQWRNDVTAAALRRCVCNAGASNAGRSLCVQISREWSYPQPIYWYHSKGNWLRYNFAAEFLYNETFQQTFRPLLSKLSKRRQI